MIIKCRVYYQLLVCCLILLLPCLVLATPPGDYIKLADGIIVRIANAKSAAARLIKIEVIADNIFHVTATPLDSFYTETSLILDDKKRPAVKWEIKESEGEVILFTQNVQAKIIISTGEVSFLDKAGNLVLQEANGGGKTFTGTTLDGEQSYIVRLAFETNERLQEK